MAVNSSSSRKKPTNLNKEKKIEKTETEKKAESAERKAFRESLTETHGKVWPSEDLKLSCSQEGHDGFSMLPHILKSSSQLTMQDKFVFWHIASLNKYGPRPSYRSMSKELSISQGTIKDSLQQLSNLCLINVEKYKINGQIVMIININHASRLGFTTF
ncbi:unnamed protein product [marine sediment metagenome]|uniref:Uncharacterized protein n=1 Tax=marine sediment metagenome TaxID=412755 RepID=X1D324_9ZZZZ